ncbi:MAG: hypothetical protein KatS3mg029_0811 [Saprospiraceae bacterium]|nr:MAG: hypothetical protein KatS3mg029_0811 [Saprospiraceae bacterium]
MEKVFREKARNMRLKPRPEAWQLLERRLDETGHRRRWLSPQRWLVAAAAIAALLTAVWWWQNQRPALLDTSGRKPVSLEELQPATGCEPYCLMIRHRSELPPEYQFPEVHMPL